MKVGEAVKKGLSTTKNSMNLVVILFVFGAFWNILNIILTSRFEATDPSVTVVMGVVGLLFILTSIFVQAGSLGFIRNKVKAGQAAFGDFTAAGSKYYLRLLFLGLFVALIIGALLLVAVFIISLLAQTAEIVGIIVGLIAAAIGIYFALLVFLAPYAVVAGEQKVMAAIKQSMSLVKQNIIGVLGIVLWMVLIGFVFGIVLGLIFAALGTAIQQGLVPQILFALLSSFINAFLGVLVSASFMAFYLSLPNTNTSA